MERKFYNLEGGFRDLRDDLRAFLKRRKYYYELSGNSWGSFWHFEVKLSPEEARDVNGWLDAWYTAHDCLSEVRR